MFFKRYKISISIVIVSVITAIGIMVYYSQQSKNLIGADVTPTTGTLSFSPSSTTVASNSNFNLGLLINTGGQAIIGYTLIVNYDSTKLQPVNTTTPVTPGTLLINPTTTNNEIQTAGKIKFAQMTFTPYNGSGTAGTIVFKAVGTGSTSVSYEFISPGAFGDSDLTFSGGGDDILNSVSPAAITISFYNFSTSITHRVSASTCPALTGTLSVATTATPGTQIASSPVTMATNCLIMATNPPNLATDTYNFTFDFPIMLKHTKTSVTLPYATQTIAVGPFIAGDMDNNDCIQMADWGVLFSKWDTIPGDAGWDATYDLKGENIQIGMEDWGMMFAGWEQGSLLGCSE